MCVRLPVRLPDVIAGICRAKRAAVIKHLQEVNNAQLVMLSSCLVLFCLYVEDCLT